ncbi:hypothetical protein BGZ60DRAFT_400304 [Tricladium varicosporioides]|nr:hypothetical protein BGZ60DRAFT_400304 [Hymenoscyphus varicosporioides]
MTGDKAIEGDRPQTISTPPSNPFDLPPSPPPTVVKVRDSTSTPVLNSFQLSFLRVLNVPPSSQLRLSFTISKGAYARATKKLAASEPALWAYVQDKLRHDLINDHLVIFRMPTLVHEFVSRKVADTIHDRLRLILSSPAINSDTRHLIQAITSLGSARVKFTKTWHREPDQQFKIKSLQYPGVILELAHSQQSKSLTKAADDYIVESWGAVQLVIGIETDPNSKNIYFSTWAPNLEIDGEEKVLSCKKTTDSDLVRDEKGNIMQGELTMNLGHFARAKEITRLFPRADTTLTVSISYTEIASIVLEGEQEQELQDQAAEAGEEEIDAETHNIKKRKRDSSSEERLLSADEKDRMRREEKAVNETESADMDYPG